LRLLPDVAGDQSLVERFMREVRILASLSHENIVRLCNAAEINGRLVMVYEQIEGVTLAERLELGRLSLPEASDIMNGLLKALDHAHTRGVIHREVTPKNIILSTDRQVKLAGFSMAKQAADSTVTMMGTPVGDVEYMSPEQVKGIAVVDARADLYSAGIVLYEMLTGKTPFRSPSQFDVMFAQVQTPPAPPSALRSDILPALDAAVLKALEKDPDRRYQSARDFLTALGMPLPAEGEAMQEAREITAALVVSKPTTEHAAPEPVNTVVPESVNTMRALFLAAAAVVLLCIVAIAFLTRS
jgi:serine/threonine-protein kinase